MGGDIVTKSRISKVTGAQTKTVPRPLIPHLTAVAVIAMILGFGLLMLLTARGVDCRTVRSIEIGGVLLAACQTGKKAPHSLLAEGWLVS
jgi:hypothetical protein